MPLSYDWTKVKDWKEIDPKVRETMVFGTMIVGLGEITEANYKRFAARMDFAERLAGGPFLHTADRKPRPITEDDCKRCIGLRTNVSNETAAEWGKRMIANERRNW